MSAAGKKCPLLRRKCIESECAFWMQLRGAHPQTGEPVDEYDCAARWLVVTQIEASKEMRQGAAAIESFRNEMVRQGERMAQQVEAARRQRLSRPDGELKEINP